MSVQEEFNIVQFLELFDDHDEESEQKKAKKDSRMGEKRRKNLRLGDDALSIILSALYAKLLVVLGMAFPTIQVISDVKSFSSRGFYLYLYIGSIGFVAYIYGTLFKEKAVVEIINNYNTEKTDVIRPNPPPQKKFGSFYLRLGAIAFGIGSMVYSGLEFGRYFDLKDNPECETTILQAITPATRMLLTLVQVQFIFMNTKNVDFNKHKIVARFGLMHMLATNLCEWLNVIVEETKHEITHLSEETALNSTSEKYCSGHVMSSLVSNSSPFLFPCTIEYSLICAVILFEMWKDVKMESTDREADKKVNFKNLTPDNKVATNYQFNLFGNRLVNSNHHFTIDCSNSHKGLFAGIMVIVLTIISLIMFFVLTNTDAETEQMAIFEVNIVELILYVITTLIVIVSICKLRNLKYDRKIDHEGNNTGIGLDCTLLVVAQMGMFMYCIFSIIGCYFSKDPNGHIEMATELVAFVQTCVQTIFVLDGWWRRCKNISQSQNQPGRQLITFLIVANMAMWTINSLEKNRAEFRPGHLEFYGRWGWTIITHVSMPLAIFYRLHSTICLFEIWKSAYKIKTPGSNYFP